METVLKIKTPETPEKRPLTQNPSHTIPDNLRKRYPDILQELKNKYNPLNSDLYKKEISNSGIYIKSIDDI